jgi:hypothetical protein
VYEEICRFMDKMVNLVTPIILPFLTAIVAAWLSAFWAVRRTYKERWWDRKERCYAEIIKALYDQLRYSELCTEEYLDREIPRKKEFSQKYSDAYWRIKEAIDIGSFVISDEAIEVLRYLHDRPKLNWDDNPSWDIFDEQSKHCKEALEKIIDCARRELNAKDY